MVIMGLDYKIITLLAILSVSTQAGTYNYPVKSINLSSALNANFYVGVNSETSGLNPVTDI